MYREVKEERSEEGNTGKEDGVFNNSDISILICVIITQS
ncbi:hypothetical protein LCGC14_3164430 [marine sediment metagenome]|uniref:Uncharacterized protein n=1 Tax=marine sediment metagenome TaxID=412755 RepID=A0A0F8WD77_9ZZZZ